MSIRIGNTVYIEGMAPVTVTAAAHEILERLGCTFEIIPETLEDIRELKPGGVVRVGRMLS